MNVCPAATNSSRCHATLLTMPARSPVQINPRRTAARTWPIVLLLVMALGIIAAVTVLVLMDRGNSEPNNRSQAVGDPDAEIQELQNQFKVYSENRQDFNNLLPEVQQFADRYPDRADGFILLGQVLMKLDRWEPALGPLGRALEIEPEFFQLQKLAGQCAAKLGRWADAEAHLNKALAMNADRDVHMMLGSVYFRTDRLDLAEAQYLLAIDKGRMTPPHLAYSGLADVYSEQGRTPEAFKQIDQAIRWADADQEVDPATYRLQKVRLLLDAGRIDDAAALLRVISSDAPRTTGTLPFARIQARLWDERGQRQAIPGLYAMIYDEQVKAQDPDTAMLAELLADLAYWRLELGQAELAARTLRDLRALSPNHPKLVEFEAQVQTVPQ